MNSSALSTTVHTTRFPGHELRDLLLAVVQVLVAVGELGAELVGAPFDVPGPPGADVVDGGERLFRGLVDDDGGLEALVDHGVLSRSVVVVPPG
jgi:hypothetical protein